ncbi:metalloregulator ArsR/SmtB family transcription factor [Rhodopseudomonas palustris]|uniref:metalloregulator ArsR/SmtB family transcription factor n=1 Tax=Rhodopseudomonas palustris TaxID=1076 RepID=UPI002ACD3FD8|nr:metalloregulator ArsR/SmtB family transcription factor [Rhodopseudomonas palustris]WQG98057.1 metalloregulator ArsR/SmtB family transcription factor [Rhodopseudomonas palustris]
MSVPKRARRPSTDGLRDVDTSDLRDNARVASEFLKTLSNPSRLVMLCLLAEGEKSVSELAATLDERQPTVSQQLARLRGERLVETRRDGQQVFYSLASEEVRSLILALHAIFCAKPRSKAAKVTVLRPVKAVAAKKTSARR